MNFILVTTKQEKTHKSNNKNKETKPKHQLQIYKK